MGSMAAVVAGPHPGNTVHKVEMGSMLRCGLVVQWNGMVNANGGMAYFSCDGGVGVYFHWNMLLSSRAFHPKLCMN